MTILKQRASPEYNMACRDVAARMMLTAHGQPQDVVMGGLMIAVAAMLQKFGEGEKDVDAFVAALRNVVADNPARPQIANN